MLRVSWKNMNYPKQIWADTDLVCDDEPHENWQKYYREDFVQSLRDRLAGQEYFLWETGSDNENIINEIEFLKNLLKHIDNR